VGEGTGEGIGKVADDVVTGPLDRRSGMSSQPETSPAHIHEIPANPVGLPANPVGELLAAHAVVGAGQRRLLDVIAALEDSGVWERDGCRDLLEWLSCHLGISTWAARRWVTAARALPTLPHLSVALETGTICLDKVLELCRFATPETERKLITWARKVTVATVRRRADVANRPNLDDVKGAESENFVRYWWELDGTRLGLEGSLPAAAGAIFAKALDRLAGRMPDVFDDDDDIEMSYADALDIRRADALVAMASQAIAEDSDADRATVVVHAELSALLGDGGCELEHGPVLCAETVRRLACDCRLEVVLEDETGRIVGLGSPSRTVSPRLMRQLRQRDKGCMFPGCGRRWLLHAHHIIHWIWGGPTELDNLILLCVFHHKLVHELGWTVALGEPGTAEWFRPNGRRFEPGAVLERAPPQELATTA
jgi:hypothetical protein